MPPPTLYHALPSPVSRGALLAAGLLGVEVQVKMINLLQQENRAPEFLRMNPLHTVPLLDDDGFVVVDSLAIVTHLADKYGKNEKAYSKDINKRSLVLQQLAFNGCVLFRRFQDLVVPIIFVGADISDELKSKLQEAFDLLEGYLRSTEWVAGDQITIADALCVATVTSCPVLGFDLSKYPKVENWVENCRNIIPDFQEANKGVEVFNDIITTRVNTHKSYF